MPNFNLFLGLIWLLVGAGILIWSAVDPEAAARMPRYNMTLLGVGALALALYNGVRWRFSKARQQEIDWMGRRFPPRKPPRVVEYNPELDFNKPDVQDAPAAETKEQPPK